MLYGQKLADPALLWIGLNIVRWHVAASGWLLVEPEAAVPVALS